MENLAVLLKRKISQDLLKAPINNIIDFFEGPATPDSIGMVNNQPVSNFLLRYHYPRLQVSPSITKQPAQQVLGTILNTTRTLANLTKQALDEGRGLTQKQKQKDNDELLKKIKQIPDNYPFSSKEKFEAATRRQLMIIAAATSKDPRLKDLTQILSGGGIDAVYEFVLTKFDWDQLVARKLLQNLDEVNRIAQTAGDIKNITEAVNKCLDNLGIENVLESFTNLKEGLKDFNKYQQYATKEIPGVSKKLAYTFILDFEQQFRRSLIEAVRQAGLRGVDFIISSALDFLVTKFGDLDDRIEKLISEKLNDEEKIDIFNGVIEDRKQAFRMEQIETEGTDPAEGGEEPSGDDEFEEQVGQHGGDRRSGTGKKEFGNEYSAKDLKDATKYERERYGKREFKGKSPLAVGKGGTIVAREGLLNQLQNKFGKNLDKSMLNEEIILDEETQKISATKIRQQMRDDGDLI